MNTLKKQHTVNSLTELDTTELHEVAGGGLKFNFNDGERNVLLAGGADTDFLDGGAGQDSAINGETVINIP